MSSVAIKNGISHRESVFDKLRCSTNGR